MEPGIERRDEAVLAGGGRRGIGDLGAGWTDPAVHGLSDEFGADI